MLQKRLLKGAGRVVPALVLLMVITAGCARAPVSGVSVKSLAADLVFGIPELPEAAPPPNTDLSPDNPIGVISTGGRGPRFDSGATPPPPIDCPEAEPTDFPKAITTVVDGSPKEGFYKWKVDKKQVLSTGGEIADKTFIERSIDDVGIVGGSLQYTTVERDLVFGAERIVRQTYEVRQGPGQDEGIYLIMRKSQSGNQPQSTFEPVPPIKYLDLPVAAGRTVNSTGVDPNSLEVQQHEGTILPHRRYDACGKLVDAWFVDAQQTFTNRRGERVERNYDYAIATQHGGLLIFEHIDAPRTNPQLKIDATIGQLEPSATSQMS